MADKCYFNVDDLGHIVEPVMIGDTKVFDPMITIHKRCYVPDSDAIVITGNLRPHSMNNPIGGGKSRFNLRIKRVIFSGPMTIVFWDDGTKTKVRLHEEKGKKKGIYDKYTAVTWAMAKKYYGSRSQLEKRLRGICDDSKYDNMLVYTMLATLFGDTKRLDRYVEHALMGAEEYNEK